MQLHQTDCTVRLCVLTVSQSGPPGRHHRPHPASPVPTSPHQSAHSHIMQGLTLSDNTLHTAHCPVRGPVRLVKYLQATTLLGLLTSGHCTAEFTTLSYFAFKCRNRRRGRSVQLSLENILPTFCKLTSRLARPVQQSKRALRIINFKNPFSLFLIQSVVNF